MWKVKMTPAFKALARRVRLTLGSLDALVERLSANPQSGDFLGHFHGFDVRQLHWSKFMVVFEVHEPSKTIRLTALVPWSPDLSEGVSFRRIVKKIILGLLAAKKFIDEARELADKFGIDIDFPDDGNDNDNLMQAEGIPFGGMFSADSNNWHTAIDSGTSGRQLICCEPGIGKTLVFASLVLAAQSDKPDVPDRRYTSHTQTRRYTAEYGTIAVDQSAQSLATNTRGGNDLATSLDAWLTSYNHWLRASNLKASYCVTGALDKSHKWMRVLGKPRSVTTRSANNLLATYFFVVDVDNLWTAEEFGVRGRYFTCSDPGTGKSLASANLPFAAQSVRETLARGCFASANQQTLWASKDRAIAEDNSGLAPLFLNRPNKSLMTNLVGSNGSTTSYASYPTTSYAWFPYGLRAFYLGVSYCVTAMFERSYQLITVARNSRSVTTKSANNLVASRSSACNLVANYRSECDILGNLREQNFIST